MREAGALSKPVFWISPERICGVCGVLSARFLIAVRISGLSRTLCPRNINPIGNCAVALDTSVLQELVTVVELYRKARGPRACEHDRIFGRDLVQQKLIVESRKALDNP